MKPSNVISDFIFSGNPVVLTPDSGISDGRYSVKLGNILIYEGRFSTPGTVDISEILDAYIWPVAEPPVGNSSPLCTVEDLGEMANREFTVSFSHDNTEETFSAFALPGGVSKGMLRSLAARDTDIFASRLLNVAANRFLSPTFSGWLLPVKETELTPLYFIDMEGGTLTVSDPLTGTSLSFDYDAGITALDVGLLRREFWDEKGVLPSLLDIYRGNTCFCRIAVDKADLCRERYLLRYRNSFGVFELMELTGRLALAPDHEDTEPFNLPDFITWDYAAERERLPWKMTLEIETGVKPLYDFPRLLDMLASDEVYLVGFGELPLKVIPSCSSLSYLRRPDGPRSFALKLQLADADRFIEGMDSGEAENLRRIFTDVFSPQFC